MNRREFLKTIAGSTVAVSMPLVMENCSSYNRKTNVILINVDDLGWTDLACFGSQYYETPNIDSLASLGKKFTQSYASCAVCSPTRASIMTGRYPARIGITDWMRAGFQYQEVGEFIPEDKKFRGGYMGSPDKRLLCPRNPLWMELEEQTIAEILKPAGYTSCHIGKWHLGSEDWYPEKQGFDYNIGGCDFGQPPTYFDPYCNNKYGAGDIPTLKPRKKGEYLTDREADEACNFIKTHRHEPFFLHMAHYAVHTPIEGRKDLVDKYATKKSSTKQKNPAYAAMVESVDQSVGKIMNTLENLGLNHNTMLILTSDNGGLKLPGCTDNSPLRSGKGYPYEGGIRIPQIIYWPKKVSPGSVCDVPVSSIDFLPTICEVAQQLLPENCIIDGRSLIPLLTGKGSFHRKSLFWHFPHYRGKDVVPYSIIRSEDWKLIKRYEGKTFELFNLNDDLSETTDLSENRPDQVRELDARLIAWLKECGAKLPKTNHEYKKQG